MFTSHLSRRRALTHLASGCATLAAPALASSTSTVVIGQSAAFTGPAAQLGIQMHEGAKIYFDRMNASGGVAKRQIVLRTLDDGYEPERCRANTETMINDKVFALFGYVGTPTCAAALPLVNIARVPLIAPFTGAQLLREPFSRYLFHVRASLHTTTRPSRSFVTS
jgi:branched-chain amino acid transport system substrate-binding protein